MRRVVPRHRQLQLSRHSTSTRRLCTRDQGHRKASELAPRRQCAYDQPRECPWAIRRPCVVMRASKESYLFQCAMDGADCCDPWRLRRIHGRLAEGGQLRRKSRRDRGWASSSVARHRLGSEPMAPRTVADRQAAKREVQPQVSPRGSSLRAHVDGQLCSKPNLRSGCIGYRNWRTWCDCRPRTVRMSAAANRLVQCGCLGPMAQSKMHYPVRSSPAEDGRTTSG